MIAWFIFLTIVVYANSDRPLQFPPSELVSLYTLNETVPIEYYYVDDTLGGNETHFKFTSNTINSYIQGAIKIMNRIEILIQSLDALNSTISQSLILSRLKKEDWPYYLLVKYKQNINGSQCALYGSMEPWLEAALIALNASMVTTLEYNNLTYPHPNMRTVSKHSFKEFYSCHTPESGIGHYDVVFSFSAFDHDGLGRYGDPLNPNGDLKAMQSARSILKPGGILFLSLPIGPDVVVFNLHRRYGNIRLPLILQDWIEIERIGWMDFKLNATANWRQTYEPIFVLQKYSDETESCPNIT